MLNIKSLVVFIIFGLSLFCGLLLGEDFTGGAKKDYEYLLPFINAFSQDFQIGIKKYLGDYGALYHSPAFYILNGYILRVSNDIFYTKILYLLISSSLPYIFYLMLKNKYKTNLNYIFYFSLLIFLSPYFRSSSMWLLGDNLSLIFLSLSILFYIKTKEEKKILNYYLSFLFLIFCCYIRYHYVVLSIYFLIYYYRDLNLKSYILLNFFCFLLSIPAIYYFFYIIKNTEIIWLLSAATGDFNYYNSSILILSIFLFYLIPFVFLEISNIFKFFKKKYKNFSLIIFIILFIYILDKNNLVNLIEFSHYGGGIFVKISKIISIETELFISILSIISIVILDYVFQNNRKENYLLLILLILCFPVYTIFQKYFDPLFLIFFFTLINSDYLKDIFSKKKLSLALCYSYFLSFLLISSLYYSYGA